MQKKCSPVCLDKIWVEKDTAENGTQPRQGVTAKCQRPRQLNSDFNPPGKNSICKRKGLPKLKSPAKKGKTNSTKYSKKNQNAVKKEVKKTTTKYHRII
ncbi:unnamed protein product [Cylindrotheca closterium]|uniref:Uncharacterized protein n=1 Tax=Cylindrotheca closterium TaxID=2856 RepID=A0AAD2FII8_9STRA|nr:unnamed protein product [Cylindrotheca closterium]